MMFYVVIIHLPELYLTMNRPQPGEYNPYFDRYIKLVPDGEFNTMLADNTRATLDFFGEIPVEKHDHSYGPGKWTIKQVLMHIIDTERVMAYRAFVASRADNMVTLPAMDENHYAAHADVSDRDMASLINEFTAVRAATSAIYGNLNDDRSKFAAKGETHPFTARALGYIMIGHIEHHFRITRDRYLQ